MGKTTKGKGRKRHPAMKRRDPKAKSTRPEGDEAKGDGVEGEEGAEDQDEALDEAEDETGDGLGEGEASEGKDGDEPSAAAPPPDDGGAAAPGGDDDEEHDLDRPGLPDGANWALPLVKLEHKWTWLETRMLFVCLIALTLVLCLWIAIRGMKEPLAAAIPAGTVFRALTGALILGAIVRAASRGRLDDRKRNLATSAAVVVGVLSAPLWRGVGIAYFEGLLDWLQEGSVITLYGGLNGLSTRLTMLVALIGGSLAAASGTHINIDVVIRLIPRAARKTVGVLSMLATTVVCLAVSFGTFDHIAITAYGARIDAPVGDKLGAVAGGLGEMAFVWRKQVGLDLGAVPWVLVGDRWNDPGRMKGRDWNAYLDEGGFVERYGAEKIAALRAPESDLDGPWQPFVVVPDNDTRGMMVRGMDLLWPVGFLMVALRFLLRALLLVAGHVRPSIEGEAEADAAGAATGEEAA